MDFIQRQMATSGFNAGPKRSTGAKLCATQRIPKRALVTYMLTNGRLMTIDRLHTFGLQVELECVLFMKAGTFHKFSATVRRQILYDTRVTELFHGLETVTRSSEKYEMLKEYQT